MRVTPHFAHAEPAGSLACPDKRTVNHASTQAFDSNRATEHLARSHKNLKCHCTRFA